MENLLNFIPEQLLILVASTNILGVFLKKMEGFKDKYITIMLMVFSIAFSMVLIGFTPTAFLQGILCWGVSIGLNQTAKQLTKIE